MRRVNNRLQMTFDVLLVVVDPGEGPRGPPPLLLDKTEARWAKKCFLETAPPTYLRVWMTGTRPPTLISRSGSGTDQNP